MTGTTQFVSRAGLKLEHALREFGFDVAGLVCADFGCNVGGFTDCLLQRGARKVYAIDTGYNVLAYKLRVDERVVVMERTNALHVAKPQAADVDLVVIDMAWTQQRHALPAAVRWLCAEQEASEAGRIPPPSEGGGQGVGGTLAQDTSGELRGSARPTPQPPPCEGGGAKHIITLVKPHYELDDAEKAQLLRDGRLDPADAQRALERVLAQMPQWGATPLRWTRSPITGGKSAKKGKGAGNVEFLVLAKPTFNAFSPLG